MKDIHHSGRENAMTTPTTRSPQRTPITAPNRHSRWHHHRLARHQRRGSRPVDGDWDRMERRAEFVEITMRSPKSVATGS